MKLIVNCVIIIKRARQSLHNLRAIILMMEKKEVGIPQQGKFMYCLHIYIYIYIYIYIICIIIVYIYIWHP